MRFSMSFQATCSQQSPRTPTHGVLPSQLRTGHFLTCKCLETQKVRVGKRSTPLFFFCYGQPPASANNEYARHGGCNGASSRLPGTSAGSESPNNPTELVPTACWGPPFHNATEHHCQMSDSMSCSNKEKAAGLGRLRTSLQW